jgi:hypothetical protein
MGDFLTGVGVVANVLTCIGLIYSFIRYIGNPQPKKAKTMLATFLLLLLLGGVTYALFQRSSMSGSDNGAATATPQTYETTTLTSVSTHSQSGKEWPVNRSMPCASNCTIDSDPRNNFVDPIVVQITVASFTLDAGQQQTAMHLSLESQYNNTDCSFQDGLYFQDEAGKTYQPGGQLKEGGSFSLAKGSTSRLTALYSFYPVANATYTLRPLSLYCSEHSIGYTPVYTDEQFQFPV